MQCERPLRRARRDALWSLLIAAGCYHPPATKISGRVTSSGSAVPRAVVTAIAKGSWRRTTTADDGTYSFEAVPFDTYAIFVDPQPPATHLGFQWIGGRADRSSAAEVDITDAAPVAIGLDAALLKDTDGDGLPDDEEVRWCDAGAPHPCANPADPDTDGDGLKDGDEVALTGTSPLRADSSRAFDVWWPNGVNDGDEDFDGDLFTNAEELNVTAWSNRTDPLRRDTDNDGLTDFEEIVILERETDPNVADTDGNGVLDSSEDLDSDGLTNREELDLRLDPRAPDSDGNHVFDGDEDFDGDGLTTRQELDVCYFPFFGVRRCLGPYDPDTDNDGTPDGADASQYRGSPSAQIATAPLDFQPMSGNPIYTATLPPGITTVDPAARFGIDEGSTSALALQITVSDPDVAGTLRAYAATSSTPSHASPAVFYDAGRTETKLIVVKLGDGGDFALDNTSSSPKHVTLQAIGRWGLETCTADCEYGADWVGYRYRSAVGSNLLDTAVSWDGTSPRTLVIDPTQAIPVDPTGHGSTYADVTHAVLSVTAIQEPAASGLNLQVVPDATSTAAPNARLIAGGPEPLHRIVLVKLSGGAAPRALIRHVSGSAKVRVALIGYFVDNAYYEAGPPASDYRATAVGAGQTRTADVRGLDGLPALLAPSGTSTHQGAPIAAYALASLTASNATMAGTVVIGGVPQLAVTPGVATTNTVLFPIDQLTGEAGFTFVAAGGQVDISVDLLGWFEYEHDWRDAAQQPAGSRFMPLAAPALIHSRDVGAELALQVTGTGGVPVHGVSQVLLSVQSSPAFGAAGGDTGLFVWGTGRKKPLAPQLHASPSRSDSQLLVVDVGAGGKISLESAGPQVWGQVSIAGWFTPYPGESGKSVALIGDSITALTGPTHYLLGRDHGLRMSQRGISGYDTRELRWWAHELGYSNPETAVVYLGTNDVFHALGGYNSGYDAVDELKRYSTEHFPSSTCVIYVAGIGGSELQTFARAPNTNRGLIDLERFLNDHDRFRQSPRVMSKSAGAPYLQHYEREYEIISGDGIHPSWVGQEALALLYQQALLGATPGRGSTLFAPAVSYPNSTPVDFARYVELHCR